MQINFINQDIYTQYKKISFPIHFVTDERNALYGQPSVMLKLCCIADNRTSVFGIRKRNTTIYRNRKYTHTGDTRLSQTLLVVIVLA